MKYRIKKCRPVVLFDPDHGTITIRLVEEYLKADGYWCLKAENAPSFDTAEEAHAFYDEMRDQHKVHDYVAISSCNVVAMAI